MFLDDEVYHLYYPLHGKRKNKNTVWKIQGY